MIDRHIRDLRLDRRLQNRRGWISAQGREEALEALPDVADKGELVTDDEADSGDPPASSDPLAND
ncbi:MAG: hypothetical protein HKP30_04490 [Myxococcales bacterium]|nr:hypothetical protein [Myxococcales bacterium]